MSKLMILFITRRPSGFSDGLLSGEVFIQSPNQYLKGHSPRNKYIFTQSYSTWVGDSGIRLRSNVYYALLVEPNEAGPHKLRLVTHKDWDGSTYSSVELLKGKRDHKRRGYCWGYGHKHFKKLGMKPGPGVREHEDIKKSPVWKVKAEVIRAPGEPHWPY